EPQAGYGAQTVGNAIKIDGVPLASGVGGNTTASGSLQAMVQLRDSVTTTMQCQLDEIARGLIATFAETDQSGGSPPLADRAGLFTWDGGPTLPADGTIEPGLAARIIVNPAMDAAGGSKLLRDGGANGADYVANSSGAAFYSTR